MPGPIFHHKKKKRKLPRFARQKKLNLPFMLKYDPTPRALYAGRDCIVESIVRVRPRGFVNVEC